MKLYNAAAPSPRRVRIFLAEKAFDVPGVDINILEGESRTPEFLKINSLGETPVLELDDGTLITECVAICRYFETLHPEPPLMGTDAKDQARVEMWNRRMEIQIMSTIGNVARHTAPFFADKVDQIPAFAESQRNLMPGQWAWLDGELADGRPFVAGDRFSIADITGMAALMAGDFFEMPVPAGLEHVSRWSESVRSRPSWSV